MPRPLILTADELIALDIEGRGTARRAARETPTSKGILRAFLASGGPLPVEDIDADRAALVRLDEDDLIRIRDAHIDVAYPFSAAPTDFVVRLPNGTERYACCATDALGIAPMVGEPIGVRSRCHHCGAPLAFSATPDGPASDAEGIMLWIGKRTEERCRGIDGL